MKNAIRTNKLSTEFYLLVSIVYGVTFILFLGPYATKYIIPYYAHFFPFAAYFIYSETRLRNSLTDSPYFWVSLVILLTIVPIALARWLI